jgi:aryl-alcohol dehydrogenase-like predicted oxidoreductase
MSAQALLPLTVGCWQLDDRSWKPLPEPSVERAIDTYFATGVHHFDTADIYGRSEQVLGRLLKGRACQISTQAVFYDSIPTATQVRQKVENSLRNLQRDRLDALQIYWHDPQLDFAATFDVLHGLMEQGKILKLGVTNFSTLMLERAVQCAKISTHQVQYSLIDRRVEQSMQEFCLHQEIGLVAYGTLAGGFLSDKFRGNAAPHPASDHAQSFFYSSMIEAHGGWKPVLSLLETLAELAQKYQKTIAQVALNWVKQQPGVHSILSGFTLDRSQIQQNAAAMLFDLEAADVQVLSERSSTLFDQPGDIYSYER